MLQEELKIDDGKGKGKEGVVDLVEKVLKYSVNTWDQGFLDKLYASTNAIGVVSELLLAVLNTNVCISIRYHPIHDILTQDSRTFTKSLQY